MVVIHQVSCTRHRRCQTDTAGHCHTYRRRTRTGREAVIRRLDTRRNTRSRSDLRTAHRVWSMTSCCRMCLELFLTFTYDKNVIEHI